MHGPTKTNGRPFDLKVHCARSLLAKRHCHIFGPRTNCQLIGCPLLDTRHQAIGGHFLPERATLAQVHSMGIHYNLRTNLSEAIDAGEAVWNAKRKARPRGKPTDPVGSTAIAQYARDRQSVWRRPADGTGGHRQSVLQSFGLGGRGLWGPLSLQVRAERPAPYRGTGAAR